MKNITFCTLMMLMGVFCVPVMAQAYNNFFCTSMYNTNQWSDAITISAQQPYAQLYIVPSKIVEQINKRSINKIVFNIRLKSYEKNNPGSAVTYFKQIDFYAESCSSNTPLRTTQKVVEVNDDFIGKIRVCYDPVSDATNKLASLRIFVTDLPQEYDWRAVITSETYSTKYAAIFEEYGAKLKLDDGLLTIPDPTLDMEASDNLIGQQNLVVSSTASITYYSLYTVESTPKVIASKTLSPSSNYVSIPITRIQSKQTYKLQAHLHTDDWDFSIIRSVTINPFHAIGTTSCYQDNNADEMGLRHPKNVISWSVPYAMDTDIVSNDMFLIERAKHADFSDAVTIGATSLIPDTVDNGYGYFRFVDDVETALTNTEALDKNDPYMYYRISRTLVASQWPNHKNLFVRVDSVGLDSYLPDVTAIKVTKQDDFNESKKVTVRVELKNPTGKASVSVGFDVNEERLYSGYMRDYYKKYFDRRPLTFEIKKAGDKWQWIWKRPIKVENKRVYFDQPNSNDSIWYAIKSNAGVFCGVHMEGDDNEMRVDETGQTKVGEVTADWWYQCNMKKYTIPSIRTQWDDGQAAYFNPKRTVGNTRIYQWDEKAQITIRRFSPDEEHYQGVDYAKKTITIKGADVKFDAAKGCYYAEIEDVQAAPFTHFFYTAKVDKNQSYFIQLQQDSVTSTQKEADACYSEQFQSIKSLDATLGTRPDGILLEWKADDIEGGGFTLQRRIAPLDGQTATDWVTLNMPSSSISEWLDQTAISAVVYEYKLISWVSIRGKQYSREKTTYGWRSYYGSVQGNLRLNNGAAMIGSNRVIVSCDEAFTIPTVKDQTGKLLMPGLMVAARRDTLYVDSSTGHFELDSLPYNTQGVRYSIIPDCGCEMSHEQGKGTYYVTISDAHWDYQNIIFTCKNVYRFSGRVLYELSTIPVAGVQFKMNGETLLQGNGEPIVTDQLGNFSFYVPRTQMKLQLYKEGHTFEKEGYFRDLNDSTYFTPTQNYDNLIMTDLTKIQLIGRIVAGERMTKLPFGQGLTSNQLGDNIHLELRLEGNNTAWIFYDKRNLDRTSRTDTCSLIVKRRGVNTSIDQTAVTFEKKRILIDLKDTTGEFVVNLPPARYKITAMSATGYSTFLEAGEGFEVLNILDSISNATYQRVVHAPVSVTYQQDFYGQNTHYIGERELTELNLMMQEVRDTVAWYDKVTDKVSYTFGYPIFKQGKTYKLRVRAHEDFYYNGDKSCKPYKVALNGGELIVRNGMESNVAEQLLNLDSVGQTYVTLQVNNPTFTLKGDAALRHVNMQVLYNGYYYDAEPLKAFVAGSQKREGGILNIGSDIEVLDVLRDPPGSGSYATREKGTTYKWFYNNTISNTHNMSGSITAGNVVDVRTPFANVKQEVGWTLTVPLNVNIKNFTNVEEGEYTMTLTESVSTSSGSFDQGAIADVYIGVLTDYALVTHDNICVIDSACYAQLEVGFKKGTYRLLSEGVWGGKKRYLVVGEQYQVCRSGISDFYYSQKHILGTVIPNLQRQIDALLHRVDSTDQTDWQALAEKNNCVYYVQKSNEKYHTWYHPKSMKDAVDMVDMCDIAIDKWVGIIRANEKVKVDMLKNTPYKTYSLGQTAITHTEQASSYYFDKTTTNWFPSVSAGIGGGRSSTGSDTDADHHAQYPQSNGKLSAIKNFIWSFFYSFQIGYSYNRTDNVTNKRIVTTSAGNSFTLSQTDNGYMDIEVYRMIDNSVTMDDNIKDDVVNSDLYTDGKARLHNFIFSARGGAMRNPWLAPDSTLYYEKGTPLSSPTLKMDNPKIYIEQPVASNVPADEKATFKVRLVNESEVNENIQYITPNNFNLRVQHTTNPDGAKLSIDGQPLTQPLTFTLAPKQTIIKTLEVERGAAYDYPCIKLEYRDDVGSLKDIASISVHYLPTSTPVRIAEPMDKWTMNTLSDKDSTGYFIPVAIDGFDVNYDQFDHIELQYKKHIEGESQWVNLCSFFASDSLYQRCTTPRQMITSGTISNFRFYGEQDPMEMEYDLRAVSFCRLGTGYVTRTSEVVSGIKDTRVPTIFGLPQPANGIWNFDDAITLNFTEPIAYNYLDMTANFSVTGYTNASLYDYSSKLYFPGKTSSQQAITQVARNLSETDFTIDMTVWIPNGISYLTLYSQGCLYDNGTQNLLLSYVKYAQGEYLMTIVDGQPFVSAKIDKKVQLAGNMHRVGIAYSKSDSTIAFIIDDKYIDTSEGGKAVCKANDKISLGDLSQELSLANVRIWNHKLSERELANNLHKRLTGRETGLIAYWPMDETQGHTARDKANGADLTLQNVSWQTQGGMSVRTNNQPFALQNASRFTSTNDEDYSLTFWFRINATKTDSAVLFRVGSENLRERNAGKMNLYVKADNLILRSNGNDFILVDNVEKKVVGQWHHFALSVSRTHNSMIACIDGQVVETASADKVDGLSGDLVQLGSSAMDAYFDQLAFWRLALPAEYIRQNYNLALKGNEMALSVYLPMHTDSVKSDNTIVPVFCPYNMVYGVQDAGPIRDKQSLMLPGAEYSKEEHAPVANNSGLKNLPFSWTSTGTALQLYIKEQDRVINNRPINLTVRSVEDLNGNSMKNAQQWTIYAHRNLLEWTQTEQYVSLVYNEQDAVFDAYWVNNSGRTLNYNIISNCDWLSCTNTMGKIDAMGTDRTTITIDKELAPGAYVTQLYLQDENELVSTLTIHVTVEATQPDWKPETTKGYSFSMNLCGKVYVNSNNDTIVDMDERDIVGAFHSGKCIGLAALSVDKQKNTSFLYMNISGTNAMNKSKLPIEFRLWRASTGEIHLLCPDSAILLRKNTTPGCQGNPVRFSLMNSRIQPIALEKGWNWISFNLQPYNTTNGVNNLFLDNKGFSDNDQFRFGDGTFSSFYVFSLTNDRFWSGDAEEMTISKNGVYQLYVAKACTVKVAGYELPTDSLKLSLSAGWNALPCWMRASTPIHYALADYIIGDKAKVGTVIKSHNQFAVATSGNQWQGSLQYLHPGEGYYVYHLGDTCSVRFLQSASSTIPQRRITSAAQREHASMMPVIAQLHKDMPYQPGDEIIALTNGEEIGRAEACMIQGQPLFLIALNAEDRSMVNFQLIRGGEVVAESEPILQYNAASIAGSVESPFVIYFNTEEQTENTPYYTPDGKLLPDDYMIQTVRVTKNKKVLRH